jgi:hypothetical protein
MIAKFIVLIQSERFWLNVLFAIGTLISLIGWSLAAILVHHNLLKG